MKLSSLLSLVWFLSLECESVDDSLVFVHALFRHGDRTPGKNDLYKASPYYSGDVFEPYGFGQLTNKGKLTEFNVGKALRQRYIGFLDEKYSADLIDTRSSDFNRTKASLLAVLAGLFPPTKALTWLEGLKWQPIPYNYVEKHLDKELFAIGCPNWLSTHNKYAESNEVKQLFEELQYIHEYLTEKTGEDFSSLQRVYYLYFGLDIMGELNLTLPDWASSIYPSQMKTFVTKYYKLLVGSPELRQMSAGYLLKKILSDSQDKIDGKFPEKKMSLLSGHEFNIACIMQLMNVWKEDEIPSYGAIVLMELHYIDQKHGFKIFYQNNKMSEPQLQKIPNCEDFCPLDDFKELVKEDLPETGIVCAAVSTGTNNWMVISASVMTFGKFLE
ncbi:hypothetical protein JTB14_002572 [Gonioctena quinquepunctata]|nr:hypothetical protein JTB14_002572 [Gonioctena quinquepunctata]